MARDVARRSLLASLLLLVASSCVEQFDPEAEPVVPARDPAGGRAPTAQPFVVHEWGTFTTLHGSQGGALDGLQHEIESVPSFVLRNVHASVDPFAAYGAKSRDVQRARGVNSKMETPVIYFYAPDERRVQVEVDFAGGLMTHWYPGHAWASPDIEATAGTVDVGKIQRTTLKWDVTLSRTRPAEVPDVDDDDAWHFARETNAMWVRTASRAGADRTPHADRYLFYRGLGRLDLPLTVSALPGAMSIVHSDGPGSVRAAFMIEMRENEGRFMRMPELPPGAGQPAPLGPLPLRDKKTVVGELEHAVLTALVEEGLFDDEARAMVRTWSRSWFGAEGTRIVYVVPRDVTDAVLPMRITPAPDRLVRVLVGRHEYLTPEFEREVETALRDRATAPDSAKRDAAMTRLARVDRFLEPAVRRVLETTQDPIVRRSANEVLRAYQR